MLSLERDEKDLKELKIITKPNKTEYYEEDLFDKTGMIIHAVYTDNTFEEITNYSVNKTILSLNDTNIEISYENKSVTLPITVKENTIKSIEIKQLPNKTNYVEGEVFDPSGMKVVVVKVNGMEKEITDYTYNKDKLTMDDTKITISYQNFTSDITITVEENIVVKLEMTTKPNKLNYIEGETFNPDGLTLIATYKDGSTKKITDYTYNKNKLTLSDETIEIEYLGFSESVSITVNESPIKEITIKTKPTKLTYVEGEVFDPSGMKVVAVKVNGMEKEITDYTYNKDKLTMDDTKITISYQNFTSDITITVEENIVVKLEMTTKPNKLNYIEGETFNPDGLTLIATYKDGSTKKITDYTYNKNKLTLSDETIEIEYLGFSESVSITVNESPIKEITIKTKPTKLTYVEGEVFDPSGMKVVAVKVNGMEKEITDYTYNKNKLTTSDTEIEITYAEYKVSLSITVTKVQDDNKNNTENVKPEVIKPEVIKPAINIPNNTTDEAEEYTFVSGENQTIDKNNRNKLRLEINANSKLLSRILINGKQLSEKDYTIDKDKLIIEINDEYLSTLDNDENIVEIALTNGQVIKTKLYINEEDNEKPIIDNTDKNEEIQTNKEPFNKNWLYSLLIIPVVYFIIAFVKRKKDN